MGHRPRNHELRHAVNAARRAQLEQRGGYRAVEQAAQAHDRAFGFTPHGTAAKHRAGCRCPSCVEAYRTYQRFAKRADKARARAAKAEAALKDERTKVRRLEGQLERAQVALRLEQGTKQKRDRVAA